MTQVIEIPIRDQLLERIKVQYPADKDTIARAIDFALEHHGNQKRASGDPYVVHPLEVAMILCDLQMDVDSVLAGLLHDVLEDTAVTAAELTVEFGPVVTKLVEGVTKLLHVKRKSRIDQEDLSEEQAENLRKMFLAMVDDVRVVIIKLSDRLHNMRTLQYLPPEKQMRNARETLDIFAPLANRLGIWQLKWQLEDLSFRYLDPEHYREMAQLLAARRTERAQFLEQAIARLRRALVGEGIRYRVTGRPKHLYSIYRKMEQKGRDFDEIYDLHGIRIITKTKGDCYHILGIVHSLWRPIHGEFDDYIAAPKENGYQSLHTAVMAMDGKPLEVQIRTEEMHNVAEFGVAAHWRYKEQVNVDAGVETRIELLRRAIDPDSANLDARQFVDLFREEIIAERVYVFTPKSDIVELPRGSTPVDFAYTIHSEIGHRCRGAKVDGRLISLDYQLQSGERVEIITAKQGGPSRDWLNPHLNFVATQRARQKIRQWFRREQRDQNIAAGRDVLEREMRRLGLDQEAFAKIAELFKYRDIDDFMAALGYGDISASQIAHKLDESSQDTDELRLRAIPEHAVSEITVDGVGDLYTQMASCCQPVPGDPIVGYITRGKGITVHRTDCPNVVNLKDTERLINVGWGGVSEQYPVGIEIFGFDRPGLLHDISGEIMNMGLNMSSAHVTADRDHQAHIVCTIGIKGLGQLSDVMNRLQNIRDVLDVRRLRTSHSK
jgi:GTP pyrophosphokinase